MYQIKLTVEQYQDLFNALFEAEKSLGRLAMLAKRCSGSDWLIEEATQESLRYKDLRRFISDTKEVL